MEKTVPTDSGNILRNSRLFAVLFLALLLAANVFLFRDFIFSHLGLYGSDTIQAGMFFRNFYAEYYQEFGKVPVWNPYQFGGIPYIDGFHGDTFYPFSKLLLVTNPFRAWGWNLFLHVFLAGITMFFCARVFARSQIAAALAAVAYMFAAYFISQITPGHDGKMFVTALFPLTIGFIELAFTRKTILYFSFLALSIGLIILTPHPQMAYYTLWTCAFYTAYKLVFLYIETRSVTRLLKPATLFATAVIVGLAISAIHFYPGYVYVKKYSPRSDQKRGEDWARSWSLHPEEVASLLVPEFCGVSGERENSYWGRNPFKDNSEYAGAVPLMLALVAVLSVRRRVTWFFGGLALFALIYALAGNTWFFYLFYYLIPNVKSTRAWSMIMFLFSFSTALLAAFGIDFIIAQSRKLSGREKRLFIFGLFIFPAITLVGGLLFSASPKIGIGIYKSLFYSQMPTQKAMILNSHLAGITAGLWKSFFFLAVPATVIWLYHLRRVAAALLLLVVLSAFIDAYRFDRQFIRTYDPDPIFTRNPLISFFESQPDKFRVLNLAGQYLPTNYLPFSGVEEMTSYHGNQPRWYENLIGGTGLKNIFNHNVINMTNTRYFLLSPASPFRGDQLEGIGYRPVYSWQNLRVYENPFAEDRASMVYDWIVEPDGETARNMVLRKSFNPHYQVVIPRDPGFTRPTDSTGIDSGKVTVIRYDNDYIELRVSTPRDGLLVLADNWFPAWKGFVDGVETEVMMANSSFRALVVPQGEHRVEFRYISETQAAGRLLTLAGLAMVLAGIIIGSVFPGRSRGSEE